MVELTMNGDVVKNLFKPNPIERTDVFYNIFKKEDVTLQEYLERIKALECPQSHDKTCANFNCHYNNRLLHKLVVNGGD